MLRFLLGVFTAICVLGVLAIGLSFWRLWSDGAFVQEASPVAEAGEISKPVESADVKEILPDGEPLDPDKVARAHADRNIALEEEIAPDTPLKEVADKDAVIAARLANKMRAATGLVPNVAASQGLINFSSGSNFGGFEDRMRDVYPAYFETWDDLMQRCYAFVADHEQLDETGLTAKDEDRINYADSYSEQSWHSRDKAFVVKAELFGGRRNCNVRSNRFALASREAVQKLKDRFHDWWALSGNARATTALEYPYTLHPNHKWYGGKTSYGSVNGCLIKVEVSEITLGGETDAGIYFVELGENDCNFGSGSSGVSGVRVNRLPQVGN